MKRLSWTFSLEQWKVSHLVSTGKVSEVHAMRAVQMMRWSIYELDFEKKESECSLVIWLATGHGFVYTIEWWVFNEYTYLQC